jgi:hypothetical protein
MVGEQASWLEILRLNNEFAWCVDHQDGVGVPELFVEGGRYHIVSGAGTLELDGRSRIAAFYEARRKRGHRTSRHLFSNMHLTSLDMDRATGIINLQLFAADDVATSSTSPVLVSDYSDEYVRVNGRWLFGSRVVRVVFGSIPDLASPGAVPDAAQ